MRELPTWNQAIKEVPHNDLFALCGIYTSLLGSFYISSHIFQSEGVALGDPRWTIAAGVIFIIGRIADNHSTIRILEDISRLHKKGLTVPVQEANPLMRGLPTPKSVLQKSILTEVPILVAGLIFPPAGIALGISGMAASWSNTRIDQQIGRASELYNKNFLLIK